MKKFLRAWVLFLILNLVMVSSGFSWGSATHAYIAKRIGRLNVTLNFQEMYGLMAADLFNYNFDLINDPLLRAFTHGQPGNEGFMAVWQKAGPLVKPLAFGFVAHNDVWGADFTAHHQAQTLSRPANFPSIPGVEPGYVIIKALALNMDPTMNGYFEAIGLSNSVPEHFMLRLEMCHNLVESAGDLIIKKVDPRIGHQIIISAVLRNRNFQELLIRALNNPEYNQAIIQNEAQFRRLMIQYGGILSLPEGQALVAMAEQMAQLGVAFLKKFTGMEVPLDQAQMISEYGIRKALQLCALDYLGEIRKTIELVRTELNNRNIRY